ncbi:hypothetical protein ACIOJD_04265 [Streptomyces sp. NPDC088116]|uniref:hypothetical protein n=1 Tax=Streptomyces sp. NPDC088116 TaxID=3365825 RepID=UPI003804E02B
MNGPDRKQAEVRRMLKQARPAAVPADLVPRATALGVRLMRRRRAARRAWWTLLFVAVFLFGLWVSLTQPWTVPPTETTPPLEDW